MGGDTLAASTGKSVTAHQNPRNKHPWESGASWLRMRPVGPIRFNGPLSCCLASFYLISPSNTIFAVSPIMHLTNNWHQQQNYSVFISKLYIVELQQSRHTVALKVRANSSTSMDQRWSTDKMVHSVRKKWSTFSKVAVIPERSDKKGWFGIAVYLWFELSNNLSYSVF